MAGKLLFTQFDPVVAEKRSGLQGLEWEENLIKRVKQIKLDKKFDESRYHTDQKRITVQFSVIANSAANVQFCDRSEISESDRISYARCTENS